MLDATYYSSSWLAKQRMMESHLYQAEMFMALGDTCQLGYAALELRLAIEKHVYEKLAYFAKRHGEKVLYEKWQPTKAIKVLCQLEPHADQSYALSVAPEKEPGKPEAPFITLGQHEALNAAWITKHYNKLGSFLHLQAKSQSQKLVPLDYLQEVLAELRRVSKSNLITSIAETVSFECPLCETKIVCCTQALPNLDEVMCTSMTCNATFTPQRNEKGWAFNLNASDFECPECGTVCPILISELRIGAGITCNECGERYIVIGNTWQLAKKPANGANSPT